MSVETDRELNRALELGDRVVRGATAKGATVAECVLRFGAELSAKVRLGKPELVEEAGHRSLGLRVMKAQRVAGLAGPDGFEVRVVEIDG